MSNALITWALSKLSNLLPLDEESLKQIITYSTELSKEDSAEHLKNLLGDGPQVLEFISSFNSRRTTDDALPAVPPQSDTSSSRAAAARNDERNQVKKNKRTKAAAPLHNAGPARKPENHGDISGGYRKSDQERDYMTASTTTKSNQGLSEALSLSPASLQPVVATEGGSGYNSSAINSRNPSPARKTTNTKLPPSAAGNLISDYLPNVKSKTSKSQRHAGSGSGSGSGYSTPVKGSVTTTNIADLTSAIAALEISTNPTSRSGQKCDCNASIHPLFTPAPNCLSCGKIICSLEGLQPCSFCGAQLLSSQEIQSMIKELRAERGQEKMKAHNQSVYHSGGPGEVEVTGAASPSKLDAAVAHRNKLLAFQAQNAQRTRVVDEAADFETPNIASTQWMSPAQRALALKKQQRILREMEEKAKPEWEKKQTVISLDIKGGRVVRSYQTAPTATTTSADADEETNEAALVNEADSRPGGAAFSKNPLLASGGLLRPIWKNTADAETGEKGPNREVRRTWRRVQDDNDDNEQWILDGGAHGYGVDSNDSGG